MRKQLQLLTLIAALGFSGAANAIATYNLTVSTGAPVLGLIGADPCSLSTLTSAAISCSTSSSPVNNNYSLSIGATASASASPGALRVGAAASISPLGGDFARAAGSIYESLIFTFPGVAAGTPGQLSGVFIIDGGLGATATGSPLATNVGLASLSMQASFGGVNIGTQGSNMFSTAGGQISSPYNTVIPVVWNFIVGPNGEVPGSITLLADVRAEANATVYKPSSNAVEEPGFASASASFSNTIAWGGISELKIDGQVITNYSVSSDSGFDYIHGYPAAVPIPTAVWLFGSGLLGLVGVARRRNLN